MSEQTGETGAFRRGQLADEWARGISLAISGSYPRGLDPEAHTWRRVMKVAEETGEVTEALLGALGENPRKGQTHSYDDVRKELLDVAVAALGALVHLGDDQPIESLHQHMEFVYERITAVVSPPGQATTPTPDAPTDHTGGEQ